MESNICHLWLASFCLGLGRLASMVFSWLHDFESANLCTNLDGMVVKCGQDYVCSDISYLLLRSKACKFEYVDIYVGMSLFWRGGAAASRDVWWFGKENYDNFFTRLPCWIMVGLRVSLFKHQVFWWSWILHESKSCIGLADSGFWRVPFLSAAFVSGIPTAKAFLTLKFPWISR